MRIASLAVPHLCDCCLIHLLEEPDHLLRVEIGSPTGAELEAGPPHITIQRYRDANAAAQLRDSVFGLQAAFQARYPQSNPSVITLPLVVTERSLGSMEFYAKRPGRSYDERDVALASEFVRWCAIVLENTALFLRTQRALRSREDSISSLSHHLRNPLTSVHAGMGLIEISVTNRLTEAEKSLFANVRRGIAQLGAILEDLADFETMEQARSDVNNETTEAFDLAALIVEVVTLTRPLLRHKSQSVELDLPDTLSFTGNRRKVQHLLLKLIDAVHANATPGAYITITIGEEPGEMRLAVAHDYQAEAENRDDIEPSRTSPHAANGKEDGDGLDMALLRWSMEFPDMWFRMEPSGGKTQEFNIRLPQPTGKAE